MALKITPTNNSLKKWKLQPQVKDLMTEKLFTLFEDDSVSIVKALMAWQNIRHLPIVNQFNELVGIVTHRDFLKVAISCFAEADLSRISELYNKISISKIMRKNIKTISPEASLEEAARIMVQGKLSCLPVVEGRKLVGILTQTDFLRAFFEWQINFFDY